MKVIHKNSREEFNLSKPQYTKLFGYYGYLVMGNDSVFFIGNGEEIDGCTDVTDEFDILIQ